MSERSQISLRTVFIVCFGVLCVVALVAAVLTTRVAITLTLFGIMIAIGLDHGASLLVRWWGIKRWLALVTATGFFLVAFVGMAFVIIPPAIEQVQVLLNDFPKMLDRVRHTHVFLSLDRQFQLSAGITKISGEAPGWLFTIANQLLSLAGAVLTVCILAIFMVIFGAPLLRGVLGEIAAEKRTHVRRVLDNIYRSIGGYVAGLALICWVNALVTATFLAIAGIPFFLPLALLAGVSSTIPYLGSLVMSIGITGFALLTRGPWVALAAGVFFVVYGQIEGNVLSPIVFRRTVHVNPLVTTLAILFLGEMAGIVGAIIAIPVVAAAQIVVLEILRARREDENVIMTPAESREEDRIIRLNE
jgi:putative heme transporter